MTSQEEVSEAFGNMWYPLNNRHTSVYLLCSVLHNAVLFPDGKLMHQLEAFFFFLIFKNHEQQAVFFSALKLTDSL